MTVHYVHQAGQRALELSAYQEAVRQLNRGLGLLGTLPHSLQAARRELALQMALGKAYVGAPGTQASEVREACARARELCEETGRTSQLCQVLGELSVHHSVRADYQRAREMAEEALRLAQEADDPLLVALGHWCEGDYFLSPGRPCTGRSPSSTDDLLVCPSRPSPASREASWLGRGAIAR